MKIHSSNVQREESRVASLIDGIVIFLLVDNEGLDGIYSIDIQQKAN